MTIPSLSTEDRLFAQKFNARARQIFWKSILPQTHPFWQFSDDEIINWTLEFQDSHNLLCDGRFGSTCLLVYMSESLGGMGGFIIDGQEVSIPGLNVIRMFKPGDDDTPVHPDLCCILSMPELDFVSRDRISGKKPVRAHFSIDSSEGKNGESLIVQWADPMRAVPFCPKEKTGDYPMNRLCVGIEIETVLNLCQLDSDERRWVRRRDLIDADINGKSVHQPDIYPQQVCALKRLIRILEKYVGIPAVFPKKNSTTYNTDMLDSCDGFRGILARFNYMNAFNEPGAGFAKNLPEIFGKLEADQPAASVQIAEPEKTNPAAPKESTFDPSKYENQIQELAEKPTPTSSFIPQHEDMPRFNLANAIAAAYSSGKAARAGRIAERCKKYDE